MGSLVTNASPFLFPCTIEYSLICAVILFEMWKKVKTTRRTETVRIYQQQDNKKENDKLPPHFAYSKQSTIDNLAQFIDTIFSDPFANTPSQSHHHFTVDCSNAHRGLFAGILVIVLTIISLIMFFVLANEPGSLEEKMEMRSMAEFEVNVVELVLYIITTVSVITAMIQMRDLKYDRKIGSKH